ncbi:hypothetical protein Mp_3g07350 [Marchantia polymorpha subsp. ruderalis]|uniref:Protein kinase domain-containing protein n=2 Tax=Marchantia polymorpha TaxID=3197 RepID=A0A176VY31_MARPO|nr:hypothetical protein AXG93_1988s1100 [Marchantia polymorpha subsp. ruderalis]PTQ48195.1 hypothetical protein MARPO_0006s0209 [Marchantia polymorpha]BBN04750.1 hypothetical protein Mp_3g07350 [Marchantia polymorpha subsp. ruderalis]|eukprot:PTQ48195.1 hypothetical protein MARPO_0006s0209 [Marchantia polymorpha]
MSELWRSPRHYDIEESVKVKLGVVLSDPPADDARVYLLLPILFEHEEREIFDGWIKCFGRWAMQEGLSDDLALVFALEYMKCTAFSWSRQFCEGHTWEDFVRRYYQRVNPDDSKVAQDVKRYMKWYRKEYRKTKRRLDATRFSARELAKATNHHSEENLIGRSVYLGRLPNSRLVAVKKLSGSLSWEALRQVQRELEVVSQSRHPNLVRLIGCSLVLNEASLVYEHIPNGNLRQHLDGSLGVKPDWETRLRIALETAQALTHLHYYSFPPVMHGDVKSSNILLANPPIVKVANFGFSRTTIDLARAAGYIDPHYLQTYQLSAKSDVYSFGIVLLEIVSGAQVVDFSRHKSRITIAALATNSLKNGRFSELVDPYLVLTGSAQDLKQCKKMGRLGLNCVSMDPHARPTMKEVLNYLKDIFFARPSQI